MKNGSLLKRALLVGSACAALFAAPVGQAGTLIIDSITGEGVTIRGAVTGNTIAGTFAGHFEGDPLFWWCVDLLKHVSVPGGPYTDYTLATFQSAPLGFNATQEAELRTVFALDPGPSKITNAHDAAVFQLAIWDVLFDDDHDLSTWRQRRALVWTRYPAMPRRVTMRRHWSTPRRAVRRHLPSGS